MKCKSIDLGSAFVSVCLAVLLLGGIGGCERSAGLQTEYGKLRNQGGSASLNGTRVLAEMFRQRGFTVNRQGALTPKLKRYQTVVWCPDRFAAPSAEVIAALENWLSEGYSRSLIYIGRDYEADLNYLQQIRDQADVADPEELQRRIAEAIVNQRLGRNRDWKTNAARDCDWFRVDPLNRQNSATLSGPWAQGVDSKRCQLELAAILKPPGRWKEPLQKTLLRVNGQPFAFRLRRDNVNGQILVVSNGSFLLNFALVNSEHRKLAENMISECDPNGAVVFLESGPAEIRIQNRVDVHQPWAWISRPPLRYIVPHLLFWGVLVCFVLYPIFGRAKRFGTHRKTNSQEDLGPPQSQEQALHRVTTTTSFRAHLVALGRLLQRSEPLEDARRKVENYLETYGKDSQNQ